MILFGDRGERIHVGHTKVVDGARYLDRAGLEVASADDAFDSMLVTAGVSENHFAVKIFVFHYVVIQYYCR
jgi:hypothetical protein